MTDLVNPVTLCRLSNLKEGIGISFHIKFKQKHSTVYKKNKNIFLSLSYSLGQLITHHQITILKF